MILAHHDSPRILILRGGALGDFILTLPVIRALRRHWPCATIELVAHPAIAGLAVVAGLVNRVRSLDASGMAAWFMPHRVWPVHEQADIAAFDLILSYLGDADGVLQANLQAAGARRLITCDPIVISGHAEDHLLRPIKELGIGIPADAGPLLPWPAALREQGRHCLKELGLAGAVIGLHPGSGSARKNWPVERFALLAKRVPRSLSAQPLFILGEADTAVARALTRLAPKVPVLANRTLPVLASVLAVSQGYVGNDSGVTHLAAALGVPVVAIFGPTDAAMWGARGAKVVILQGHAPPSAAWANIDPDAVLQALVRSLAQSSG